MHVGKGLRGQDSGHRPRRAALRSFVADDRGVVMTEYVVVTGLVGVACLAVLLASAWTVAASFAHARDYVLFPFP